VLASCRKQIGSKREQIKAEAGIKGNFRMVGI
jgi:hypothetical protein